MNTDSKPDLHKLENSKLLLKDEMQQILGLILNFKHARLEWERIVR